MTDDRPITPEQALLAVKAAGLDPHKSLSEQLNGPAQLDEQPVKGWVTEAIGEAMGAAGQGAAAGPTPPQPHERLAKQLHDAQSRWITLGGPGGSDDGQAA
jgi:hypothetical protein